MIKKSLFNKTLILALLLCNFSLYPNLLKGLLFAGASYWCCTKSYELDPALPVKCKERLIIFKNDIMETPTKEWVGVLKKECEEFKKLAKASPHAAGYMAVGVVCGVWTLKYAYK